MLIHCSLSHFSLSYSLTVPALKIHIYRIYCILHVGIEVSCFHCPLVAQSFVKDTTSAPTLAITTLHSHQSRPYLCPLPPVSKLFGLRCYKIHVKQSLLCFCTLHCLRFDSFVHIPQEKRAEVRHTVYLIGF